MARITTKSQNKNKDTNTINKQNHVKKTKKHVSIRDKKSLKKKSIMTMRGGSKPVKVSVPQESSSKQTKLNRTPSVVSTDSGIGSRRSSSSSITELPSKRFSFFGRSGSKKSISPLIPSSNTNSTNSQKAQENAQKISNEKFRSFTITPNSFRKNQTRRAENLDERFKKNERGINWERESTNPEAVARALALNKAESQLEEKLRSKEHTAFLRRIQHQKEANKEALQFKTQKEKENAERARALEESYKSPYVTLFPSDTDTNVVV